jgi:serine/threonine protein kinase
VEDLHAGDPRQVGRYRLLGRIGSGGMGRVFLGQSPGGRLVAVKVIRSELADSPDFRARFAHEVAAARKVSGIFTAPVVDADPDAPQPWLVTGYVDGPSLADAVADRGRLDLASVRALACGLAEGLAAIHAAGVIHRDLKPSNVLLAADGPRIIDFGISRAADATSMTHTGAVVGSPGFMSPEQAEGRDVGPASDIFSLGSVLAFAATGREPFGTGDASALLYRVVHGRPALAGVPEELHPILESCLRREPALRPTPGYLLSQLNDEDTLSGQTTPLGPANLAGSRAGRAVAAAAAHSPKPGGRSPGHAAGRRPLSDSRSPAFDHRGRCRTNAPGEVGMGGGRSNAHRRRRHRDSTRLTPSCDQSAVKLTISLRGSVRGSVAGGGEGVLRRYQRTRLAPGVAARRQEPRRDL